MKYTIAFLLFLLTPTLMVAQEAAAAAAPGEEMSGLQMTIVTIVTGILAWVFKLVRTKLKVNAEQNKLDANKSLLEQKEVLLRRIGDTTIRVAETWVEDNIPALVKDATDGGGFEWKTHFRQGYNTIKQEVKQVFADEGIDILKVVGERRLAGMIKSALTKAITYLPQKFQGFLPETLLNKLSEKISEFVTAKTSDWVEGLIDNDEEEA